MKSTKWMFALGLSFLMLTASSAFAQGTGHGKGHNKHGDDDDQGEHYYKDHDSDIRGWYDEHQSNLPPGLAKKDRLPPGLEKQLVRRGELPPGPEESQDDGKRSLWVRAVASFILCFGLVYFSLVLESNFFCQIHLFGHNGLFVLDSDFFQN